MKNTEKQVYIKETIDFLIGKGLDKKNAKTICWNTYNVLRLEMNNEIKNDTVYV